MLIRREDTPETILEEPHSFDVPIIYEVNDNIAVFPHDMNDNNICNTCPSSDDSTKSSKFNSRDGNNLMDNKGTFVVIDHLPLLVPFR